MHRWRTTQQILSNGDEIWDDNWADKDSVGMPPSVPWDGNRPMRIEDVDVWEVITQSSMGASVYAAWLPYGELYIVVNNFQIVQEFSGWNANKRLEQYLIANGIPYPKGPDNPVPEYEKSLIVVA